MLEGFQTFDYTNEILQWNNNNKEITNRVDEILSKFMISYGLKSYREGFRYPDGFKYPEPLDSFGCRAR